MTRRFSTVRSKVWAIALITSTASGITIGCASAPISESAAPSAAPQSLEAGAANGVEADLVANQPSDASGVGETVARSLPQLIKRAEMTLTVETVDKAIDQINALARRQGGDVLNLENYTPASDNALHTAFVELRIPQARLDDTLAQLKEVGTVERQTITAEDVSGQLVDFEAQLKNLRKAEEVTLGIMERSGEIGDVLKVGQELQNIRASIEQIAGRLQQLRNQVSYSTVRVNLEGVIASTPEKSAVTSQLKNTWTTATRSVSDLTIGLVHLSIWLLVYSPYWLIFGGLGYFIYRRNRRSPEARPVNREHS
ncbi:MAG: DUF4349 domain-containing protein [Cyanobacteria bacterium P01_F01_bin.150]